MPWALLLNPNTGGCCGHVLACACGPWAAWPSGSPSKRQTFGVPVLSLALGGVLPQLRTASEAVFLFVPSPLFPVW